MRSFPPVSVTAALRKPLAGVSRGEFSDRELGSYATRPAGCDICMCPSRCWFPNGHLGALIGIWWKLTEPRRESCVSNRTLLLFAFSRITRRLFVAHDCSPFYT